MKSATRGFAQQKQQESKRGVKSLYIVYQKRRFLSQNQPNQKALTQCTACLVVHGSFPETLVGINCGSCNVVKPGVCLVPA